jgi:radical SAM superfamily enzyme YgiQ (UPF0313 family)
VKILFLSTNRLKVIMPPMPLGLASVIAQIDASRHELRVLDLMFSEQPEAELQAVLSSFAPELIAVSIRNLDNQSYVHTEYMLPHARSLLDICRQHSTATIVVGGAAFSVSPVACFAALAPDYGIAGEGELAFRDLVDRVETGGDPSDVPGLVWRAADGVRLNPPRSVEDLDALKPPRRDLFDNGRYAAAGGFGNIVIKQGCSFECLYCEGPNAMGRQWRKKSPAVVVDELEAMRRQGINVAFFTDAIFNFPVAHAKAVCREILRRKPGIFWLTPVHPAYLDRELIALMQQAGCTAVTLGCDSGSEKMLRVLRKGFNKEQLCAAAEALEEAGLNYILSLLFGGPGEDRQTVEETIAFVEQRRPFMVDLTTGIRLMPGTDLARIAVREGVIRADDPLLEPKFYISDDIKDWIEDYLSEVCSRHPGWGVTRPEAQGHR